MPRRGKYRLLPPTSKNWYNRVPLIAEKCKSWPSKTRNSWPSSVQGEKFPVLVKAKMAKKSLAVKEERTRIRIRIGMTREVLLIRIGCPIRVRWWTPLDLQQTPESPNWRKS